MRFSVNRIRTKQGEEHALTPDGLTLIVGPNNVGKSLLLREIAQLVGDRNPQEVERLVALSDIATAVDGTPEELVDWLKSKGVRVYGPPDGDQIVQISGSVTLSSVMAGAIWSGNGGLGLLRAYWLLYRWRTPVSVWLEGQPNTIRATLRLLIHFMRCFSTRRLKSVCQG